MARSSTCALAIVLCMGLTLAAPLVPAPGGGFAGTAHAQGAGKGNCPPGLAKRGNGCTPPGQAKRGVSVTGGGTGGSNGGTGDDSNPLFYVAPDGTEYYLGDRIEGTGQVIVDADTLRALPLLEDGRAYLELDGQVVEVLEDTNTVVRALGIVSDFLN